MGTSPGAPSRGGLPPASRGRVGQAGLAGRSHPDRQVCVSDTRVPRRGARRGPGPKRCMTERCCVLFAPRFRAEQGGHRPRQEGLLVLRHHRVHGARGGEPAGTHAERGLVVLRGAHGNGPPAPPAPRPPRPAQRPAPPRRARPRLGPRSWPPAPSPAFPPRPCPPRVPLSRDEDRAARRARPKPSLCFAHAQARRGDGKGGGGFTLNVLLQNPSTQSQKRSRAKTHKERNVVTSTSRRSNFLAIACSQSLCPGAVHSGHSVVAMDTALAPHPRARPHVALPIPPAGLRARSPRLPLGQHSLTALQGRPAPRLVHSAQERTGREQVRRGAVRAPRLPRPPPQPQPTRLPPRTPQPRAVDPRAAPAGFWSRGVSGEPEAGPGASGASATWSRGPPLSPVGSECRTARLPVDRCPWNSQEAAPTPQTRMPAQ